MVTTKNGNYENREKLIIEDIKRPRNSEDSYDLVMGKSITDSIISSFLSILKVNYVDIKVVCPLFLKCVLNKELPIQSNM